MKKMKIVFLKLSYMGLSLLSVVEGSEDKALHSPPLISKRGLKENQLKEDPQDFQSLEVRVLFPSKEEWAHEKQVTEPLPLLFKNPVPLKNRVPLSDARFSGESWGTGRAISRIPRAPLGFRREGDDHKNEKGD